MPAGALEYRVAVRPRATDAFATDDRGRRVEIEDSGQPLAEPSDVVGLWDRRQDELRCLAGRVPGHGVLVRPVAVAPAASVGGERSDVRGAHRAPRFASSRPHTQSTRSTI